MSQDEQPTAFTFEGFEPANTTPVPDVLFDELLTVLSGPELKVLLYIIRRTLGFKKSSDGISLSQFTDGITTRDGKVLDKGCGIKKRSAVSKILKDLIGKGCIKSEKTKTNDGDSAVTVYSVRFKGVVPKTALPSDQIDTTVVPKKTLRGSAQTAPTGSAVLVTHNKQLTTNSNVQETEEQEENTAHVSTDTHASLSRPLVFHPLHDFIALDDAIAPKEMTVFMTPEKYFSEYEDKRREHIASEVHYELQQRGHSVTFKWEQEPESNYKFAPEVVDASLSNSPSSLQETEESTPAPSDEQSSKQAASHSQSTPNTTQDSAKQAPTGKPGKASSQPAKPAQSKLIEDEPKPPARPQMPAESMKWGTHKCKLMFDAWRGAPLMAQYKLNQSSGVAKNLSTYYSEDEVKAAKMRMDEDEYYIDRGGADIFDVGNNIAKYLKIIEKEAKFGKKKQQNKGNLNDQRTRAGIKTGVEVGSSMPPQKPEPTKAELDEIERKMIEMGIKPATRKGA